LKELAGTTSLETVKQCLVRLDNELRKIPLKTHENMERCRERIREETKRLKSKMEKFQGEMIKELKERKKTYSLLITFSQITSSQITEKAKIDKVLLQKLVVLLEKSLKLKLLGIDNRLIFVFEADFERKDDIMKNYQKITAKLEIVFDVRVKPDRCIEGENLGVTQEQMEAWLGNNSHIQVISFGIASP
jgi:hypothetical protein